MGTRVATNSFKLQISATIRFMHRTIRILFITSLMFLSPAIGLTTEARVAHIESRCVEPPCPQTSLSPVQSKTTLADFSPTPVQLLVAGVGLIVVRLLAKKYLLHKAE